MSPQLVLGKRAEVFFNFTIKNTSRYEMAAQNLQVIHEKKTLGEFDFFLRDRELKEVLHVELVYKFYLFDPSISKDDELKCWIGPNRKDSFLRKINRLKEHQFPLLYRPESEKVLSRIQLNPRQLKQKVCFKANLFVPKNDNQSTYHLINPNAIIGYWMHLNEFTEAEYGQDKYFSPQKKDWPIDPAHLKDWMDFKGILTEIDYLFKHNKAAYVWRKIQNGGYERFFIVWW
ncbi:DUF1853 family protein [Mesonia algae]|nr:DUF1853 family protein [Mesonia algae]